MTADMKPKDKDLSPESNEMIEGKREDHHGDKQNPQIAGRGRELLENRNYYCAAFADGQRRRPMTMKKPPSR